MAAQVLAILAAAEAVRPEVADPSGSREVS
jgi:hypothetical protein